MRYIGPKGIPYSEWLGWDQFSRDAAMAWQAREADRCPQCGQLHSEWLDGDGKDLLIEVDGQLMPPKVVQEFKCPACTAIAERQETAQENGADDKGIHYYFTDSASAIEEAKRAALENLPEPETT
jgi:hypothetical protein